MNSGIERLTDIVGGLKSYARLDSGKKRPAVINDCINESLKLCQNRLKYSVKLDIRLSENLPKVLADPGQIIQVLVNLFINAADALEMVGGGTLGVNTMLTHERTALSIVVYDTGPGISADVAAHLFNPFFTTKEAGKGTGLGLSISRTIIEEHGGSIAVSRHHQGGAQFTVVLPLTTQPD
jgi:C4-dicarboxylate-specific signal transduction histidine kinase